MLLASVHSDEAVAASSSSFGIASTQREVSVLDAMSGCGVTNTSGTCSRARFRASTPTTPTEVDTLSEKRTARTRGAAGVSSVTNVDAHPTPRQVLPGRGAVRHRGRGLVRQRKPGVGDVGVRQAGRIRVPPRPRTRWRCAARPGGGSRQATAEGQAPNRGVSRTQARGVRRRHAVRIRRRLWGEGDARVLVVFTRTARVSSDAEGGGARGRMGTRENSGTSMSRECESRRPGRARGRVLSPVRRHSRIRKDDDGSADGAMDRRSWR